MLLVKELAVFQLPDNASSDHADSNTEWEDPEVSRLGSSASINSFEDGYILTGTGRFELKILVPAHSDVVTNNVRIDSDSSTKEELRRHFWDAASEKAVLHALVLKRLHLEEPAEPALDESLDESALELRAASERADSQQATSTCGSQELTGECALAYMMSILSIFGRYQTTLDLVCGLALQSDSPDSEASSALEGLALQQSVL